MVAAMWAKSGTEEEALKPVMAEECSAAAVEPVVVGESCSTAVREQLRRLNSEGTAYRRRSAIQQPHAQPEMVEAETKVAVDRP